MKHILLFIMMVLATMQISHMAGQTGIKLLLEGPNDATLSDGAGILQLGNSSGPNVVMDRNEILARNNGVNSTLFLNIEGGGVKTGQEDKPSDLYVTGYARLGNDSTHPYIRTKKITGVNSTGGATNSLPLVIDDFTKILSIDVMYEDDFGGVTFFKHREVDFHEDDRVALTNTIPDGKSYVMYIVYEK